MSTKSHVCLGAQYRNPDARSSGKAVNPRANSRRATSVQLAAHIARSVGMVRTWANLQTIRIAIESEAEYSDISISQSAALITSAAHELNSGPSYSCLSSWEQTQLRKQNDVDRFWFEDARWRMKSSYWNLLERLREGAAQ